MESPDEEVLEQKLRDAQAAVIAAREATRQRQDAVREARAAGWSKYKIAAVLGVKPPTVDSILKAKTQPAESQLASSRATDRRPSRFSGAACGVPGTLAERWRNWGED